MPNGNDEGNAAGFKTLDEPALLLPFTQGQDGWEDFLNSNAIVDTQAVAGYAPSPYVPFRVQVKARDSIPDSELGNVPDSEVRKADDPEGDAGFLTFGENPDSQGENVIAGALTPIPDTPESSPLLVAGSSGQDISLEPNVDSNFVDNVPILGNGDTDPPLALAFADVDPSSGVSGVRLTDPLFANPNSPSPNSGLTPGSLFASASLTGDSIFSDFALDEGPVAVDGASRQASLFSPDDSAPGYDNNGNSNPNNQDESFLRNPGPIDWSDPCNLVHGSDTPFSDCTFTTSRTVFAPFRVPTVPRPDSDIAVDDVADLP